MKPLRGLRRFLRLCFFALLVLLLLVAGGVWWAHVHLARLTVELVNRTYPDLELSADKVAFSSFGTLDLKGVRLRVRHDGSTALSVPSAQARFTWEELQQNYIREIVLDTPKVRVTDALLKAVRAEPGSLETPETATETAPWKVGKLSVKGGVARVELAGQPALRFGFEVQMAEKARLGNQIQISSLQIREPASGAEIAAIPSLKVVASPEDLRRGKLRELVIEAPRLSLDDRVLAMLPKSASEQDSGTPWSCDRLIIQRGSARLDLAAYPQAQFDFSIRGENLAPNGGGPIELSLEAIRAQLRGDPTPTVSIASVRIAGTMTGLARGAIQEIAIDEPVIRVTDLLRNWTPPASAKPPETTEPSPPIPWKADRFTIKRGRVLVDLEGAPLAEFGFGARLQNAGLVGGDAEDLQSLEVLDLALKTRAPGVEPFLRVPAIRAEFRLPELIEKRRLARLRIEHLDFRYHAGFREMIASGAKPAPVRARQSAITPDKAPQPTIGELRLVDGRVHLDDLGIGIPAIECRVETAFRELILEPGGGAGGKELQTIELSQIALRSPLDPFVTVLNLDTLFIRFTLAGLWARQIEEVAIVRPTLAIGPDLFWYIDRVQQNQDAPPAIEPAPVDDGPPWTIQTFSAKSGQLVLALEGQAKLALPMPFESYARNLNFRRLSDLRLKLQIDMPEQDYDYPGYELALRGVSGRIEFSLPPEKRQNNVVNTLRLRGVRWKNFRSSDVFLDVTYDEKGVYGNLTGQGYSGIIRGQFNFLLTPESDWDGWVSGTNIDLQPITAALAPEKFSLSSPADFRLSVAARASEILKVVGDFKARRPGEMRIGKLDDFIRDLPGDWSGVKRGLSRISLETLRDFAYDTAHGDFKFTGLVGAVHLDLRGPGGSRKIEMNFHEAPPAAASGRVAKTKP